jgi:tRNA(fMet)-specific endonuclease VapC
LTYLLDTNVCIALINDRPRAIRAQFDKQHHQGAEIYVSAVALFELWYGISKGQRREANAQLLAAFLSGPVRRLAFDEQDAQVAGKLRAELESIGRPTGLYDLLTAGQALRHKMTLVTANAREFGRIKNLSWEDWSRR